MATLSFIPATKSTTSNEMSLEDIPDEIKNDAEEVYALLKTNPGRVSVTFPSAGEAEKYVNLMKAYCRVRPDGEVRFRRSPTRKLPAGTVEFRITDLQTEEEATTADIRQSVDAVKAAAKKN